MDNKEPGQSGYMRSDDVQNVNYSNDHTDFENKLMVYNEMFKLRLTLSINLSAT